MSSNGTFIGTGSGRKKLVEPVIGTAGGNRRVEKVWCGDAAGVPRIVFERTSALAVTAAAARWDVIDVAWGASAAVTVFRDGVLVWSGTAAGWSDTGRDPSTKYTYVVRASGGGEGTASATTLALRSTLTAAAVSSSQINLGWTQPNGLTGWVLRSSIGQVGTYGASTLSASHTGLAASTGYNYSLDAVRGSQTWQNVGTANGIVTQPPPAPVFQQRQIFLDTHHGGSYSGSGALRSTSGPFYSGYYSGTWGVQRSAFVFAVPADLRNCVSVDRVRISVKNAHSYSGSGVTQHLAVTHTPTLGSSWPGSTGSFGGRATAKGGWYGGAEWVDITNDREPNFNDTVANNFRLRGACGICLVPPNGSTAYYSYWGSMRIEFVYTIRTG